MLLKASLKKQKVMVNRVFLSFSMSFTLTSTNSIFENTFRILSSMLIVLYQMTKFRHRCKLKAFADNTVNMSKDWFALGMKNFGKRNKCWLPSFSPIQTIFSKDLFSRVV